MGCSWNANKFQKVKIVLMLILWYQSKSSETPSEEEETESWQWCNDVLCIGLHMMPLNHFTLLVKNMSLKGFVCMFTFKFW